MILNTKLIRNSLLACGIFFALGSSVSAATLTVLTVPLDPNNPTTPHYTYPVSGSTEISIPLGATVPGASTTDKFTVVWSFGDGVQTTTVNNATINPYNIGTTHQYPASSGTGTQWTATVSVTDNTSGATGTANYYVIQEPNWLPYRVSVAIDWGLWYMHETMWRGTTVVGSNTVPWGGWDTQSTNCTAVNGNAWDCLSYGSINASNVQAFEVSKHLASGPATDPYTDDVGRGLARMLTFLSSEATQPVSYTYDPLQQNFTCQDGSVPSTTDPACAAHGGKHLYNPTATSCSGATTAKPCTITYDGNNNKLMTYSSDGSGEYSYTTSPFLDALVSAATPTALATTGGAGILGAKYQDIIQDILDFYGYSQYGYDYDVSQGYTRGYAGSDQGGGWLYGPQQGDDNSTSQWAAIAYISALRGTGLGFAIPASVSDFNNVWITNGQDVTDVKPTGADPYAANDNYGAFGYRGSFAYSNEWGPFAVTPSGLVQMAMDDIGRTSSTVFGDATTAFDQRWNNTETYYADNFCNVTTNGAYYAPRAYTYGMFSFTKGMLLSVSNGTANLSPIQYLRTLTPNVFTTNSSVPPNTIDWYGAVKSPNTDAKGNVGTDPCDGFAQTLISLQLNPSSGVFDGHWYGNDYESPQYNYETAWSVIILNEAFTTPCFQNLTGAGAAGNGSIPPRIDLSWSNQASSTSYNVLRSSSIGGTYSLIGTTTNTSYSDTSSLVNGNTYYYVVDPINGSAEVCQSNTAAITVPKPATGRH